MTQRSVCCNIKTQRVGPCHPLRPQQGRAARDRSSRQHSNEERCTRLAALLAVLPSMAFRNRGLKAFKALIQCRRGHQCHRAYPPAAVACLLRNLAYHAHHCSKNLQRSGPALQLVPIQPSTLKTHSVLKPVLVPQTHRALDPPHNALLQSSSV